MRRSTLYVFVVVLGLTGCSLGPGERTSIDPAPSPNAPPSAGADDAGAASDAGTVDAAGAAPSDADAGQHGGAVTCKVSFETQVLPGFDRAGCTSTFCHGAGFLAPALALDEDDADATYKALVEYRLGGKPYVKAASTNPAESAITCHLAGQCGRKMPPGGGQIPSELVTSVAGWIACGAPKN